ncbi:hypothetical protein D3C80_1825650 [compost metagenome]
MPIAAKPTMVATASAMNIPRQTIAAGTRPLTSSANDGTWLADRRLNSELPTIISSRA